MKYLLTLVAWAALLSVSGQNTFSVDTTYKYHKHEANDLVFYMNIPIHNLSGQDLKMGFERNILYLSPTWQTNVQCVDSFFAPARDTGTFWLPKDFTFNSLIACYFYPNKTIGNGLVEIKIYNYQDPGDSVILTFGGETFIVAGVTNTEALPDFSVTRLDQNILIQSNGFTPKVLEVFDVSGRFILKQPWPTGQNDMTVSPPAGISGVALARIHNEKGQVGSIQWFW